MTAEEESWAEAAAILKWQGDHVAAYVGGRIAQLAKQGDAAALARFYDLAEKVEALANPGALQ